METITIGQIASAIGVITVIAGFCIAIFKWYKTNITDKLNRLDQRLTFVEIKREEYEREVQFSNLERKILLKGELAALKGLKEMGCNDAVTKSIEEIEQYMMDKTHDI